MSYKLKILDINPSIAGISGDMFISALLDLFEDSTEILKVYSKSVNLDDTDIKLEIKRKNENIYDGNLLSIENELTKLTVNEINSKIDEIGHILNLDSKYFEYCKLIYEILIEGEKNVHKTEQVHLHELGTYDTVIDITLTAYLLQKLEIQKISFHPIATGRGMVNTKHGKLAIPPPVSQHIIEKYELETMNGPIGEAATPTGIAIIAALKKLFPSSKSGVWIRKGIGFGNKIFDDRPNILVLRYGNESKTVSKISILETNLDDISGEILGDAMNKLLKIGALDVSYFPIYMKKNRPGYMLKVLVKEHQEDEISKMIMKLTGTLGVRIQKLDRHIGERKSKVYRLFVKEFNEEVSFSVKIGNRTKIEFRDISELADRFEMSPLEVNDILTKYLEE